MEHHKQNHSTSLYNGHVDNQQNRSHSMDQPTEEMFWIVMFQNGYVHQHIFQIYRGIHVVKYTQNLLSSTMSEIESTLLKEDCSK